MKSLFILFVILLILTHCVIAKLFKAFNSDELKLALKIIKAGDTLEIADGIYIDRFKLANRNASKFSPIIIKGSKKTILSYKLETGYCLYLNRAKYIILTGFTLTNCMKGIMIDRSSNIILENLDIHHIGHEAVHFRYNSSDNIIQNSVISNTGRISPGIGEGVYIGSAVPNWPNGQPDCSNRNKVLNNHFGPNVTAEAIDIKEATQHALISGNYFDGTGMSGIHFADSWVDVKGYKNVITNNTGSLSVRDGFQVHDQRYLMTPKYANLFKSGCNNVFKNNICNKLTHNKSKCVQLKSVTACNNKDINNIISN